MLKNKHYYPHPADLRNDRRMKRAMKDFPGAVGYGVIVWLFERLRCENNFEFPFEDLDLLSDELDVSLPILQTIIKSYDFFRIVEKNEGTIFISPLLNELMEPYLEKVEKNRIAGKISAKKRKQKQLEQLSKLSDTDSSEHMLDISSTNIKEKNRKKDKKENLFYEDLDFKSFKELFIKNYAGIFSFKLLNHNELGLLPNTVVSLKSNGYLFNELIKKDFTKEQSYKVWNYMYENRTKFIK